MTLIQYIKLFTDISTAHRMIKYFGFGPVHEYLDSNVNTELGAHLWLEIDKSNINKGVLVDSFTLYCMDYVNKDITNRNDVLSDTKRNLEDVIALLHNPVYADLFELDENAQLDVFYDEQNVGEAFGWKTSISLKQDFLYDSCQIPLDGIPVGEGGYVVPTNWTPNINWGDILGTLSNQTDLQNALNLKADKSTTLEINGTTYDLSANRTWSLGLSNILPIGNTTNGNSINTNNDDQIQLGDNRAIVLYYHTADGAGELRHTVTGDEISLKDSGGIEITSATALKLIADLLLLSGYKIDTTSTGGTDVLNIGTSNADVVNIGRSGATVNILGAALYEYAANQYVLDKLITLNYSGAAASGVGVGFEIEENNVITGYFKTNSARNAFEILTPAIAYKSTLGLDLLTADRTHKLPNESGTLLVDTHFCKIIASNYTPVSGTAVITQEILHAHQIAAGLVLPGDIIKIFSRLTQNNSGGTKIYRIWINSSNSLTGAVQIGQHITQTTNTLQGTERFFPVLSDTTLRGAGTATQAINGEWTGGAFTPTTFTVTSLSAGFYILITGQKNTAGDTDTINASWVELVR